MVVGRVLLTLLVGGFEPTWTARETLDDDASAGGGEDLMPQMRGYLVAKYPVLHSPVESLPGLATERNKRTARTARSFLVRVLHIRGRFSGWQGCGGLRG